MIAVDSSAVLALALAEADADRFAIPLTAAPCTIGWPTLLEIHLVLHGGGKALGLRVVEMWRRAPNVKLVAFDQPLFDCARAAFDQFGRGRHPAKLNFGDCMAYAVAKQNDLPLLYKGTDFALTDIRSALS